ncbi:MAG: glycosyltransferase, partial [Cyanobacteria bacterium J06573_2]
LLAFSAFTILVLTPTVFVSDASRQLPLKQLSQLAAEIKKPGEEIVMVGFKKPSVAFYAQSKINYIKTNREAADYIKNQTQSNSILVLAEPKRFPELGVESTEYEKLAEKQAYGLIRANISEQ